MKKLLLVVTLATSVLQMNAQMRGGGDGDLESPNIVKLNISAIGAGSISLQYERFLKSKLSVCLGGRLGIPRTIPGIITSGSSSATGRYSSFAIAPEVRYYLGEGNGKGFYVGLLGKYDNFKITVPYNEVLASGKLFDAELKGKISSFGPGLSLGSQWKLGEKMTFDWWIAAPYYAIGKAYVGATSSNFGFTTAELNEINTDLVESFDNSLVDFADVTVNNQEISLGSKLNTVRVRVGLAFGYRF